MENERNVIWWPDCPSHARMSVPRNPMKPHWLLIGALAISATLFAQAPYPYPQSPYPAAPRPAAPPSAPRTAPLTPGPLDNSAPADEPGRAVARLGILNGDASVKRGDSADWVAAAVNAPLMSGDQISVAAGGRAEIQLD